MALCILNSVKDVVSKILKKPLALTAWDTAMKLQQGF